VAEEGVGGDEARQCGASGLLLRSDITFRSEPISIILQEGAKIYASNAIRTKNQALNFLRLSSRIDAVAAR
jgi:hypothetical protein